MQASSAGFKAGNFATISLDGIPVTVAKNENDHYRGLHMVIINSSSGKVESAQVFDTYKSSEQFDAFIDIGIPEGHIVIAACKDECATNLSDKAREWFANLGSKLIWGLEPREGFAFLGISGQKDAYEKRSEHLKDQVQIT